eukprot:SAG31_NODE_22893_length_516_cov_0.563549_1_plen_74_part_10
MIHRASASDLSEAWGELCSNRPVGLVQKTAQLFADGSVCLSSFWRDWSKTHAERVRLEKAEAAAERAAYLEVRF